MDGEILERIYQESLEERIIGQLVQEKQLSYEDAMKLYYNSRFSEMIQRGDYGIQYLDYKILAQLVCEEAQ